MTSRRGVVRARSLCDRRCLLFSLCACLLTRGLEVKQEPSCAGVRSQSSAYSAFRSLVTLGGQHNRPIHSLPTRGGDRVKAVALAEVATPAHSERCPTTLGATRVRTYIWAVSTSPTRRAHTSSNWLPISATGTRGRVDSFSSTLPTCPETGTNYLECLNCATISCCVGRHQVQRCVYSGPT